MKCVLNELETSGSCSPIGGIIHTAYTFYHPLLADARIHVFNNSHTVEKDLIDGILTLSGNTNNAITHQENPALQINASPNDLIRCTYSLQISTRRRLHTGDNAVSTDFATPILFFYQG